MVDTDHSVGVGGDVLTHCNKCELDLWHTVMAKVDGLIRKVKCNTCGSEHMLRGEAKKPAHKRVAKPPMNVVLRVKDRVPHKPWGELLAGRDQAGAIAWAIGAKVAKNDLLKHPSFGVGVVTDLSDDKKKATVLFESGEKVLAVGR